MSFGNNPSFGQPNATAPTGGMPTFAQPASSSGFDLGANEGALLMITPTEYKEGIATSFGEKTAVEADVVILDGPNAGENIDGALIFPLVLQGQLRKFIGSGQVVLGRLGKGQAKQGQQAPWKLSDSTPEDQQIAQQWFNQNANDLPSF